MTDGLFLSQSDSRPMYQQIMEQIKQKVVLGDWPPGQALPSIRELAVATKVSVITVKRAYTELENEGVIVTRRGKGSFVAESCDVQTDILNRELEERIEQLNQLAKQLGLSEKQLLKRISETLKEH